MTRVIYETKTLISIYHLSIVRHLKWFPKCIESYWLMVSKAKKKNDFNNWKHLRAGFPWIFIEPKELLQMVFHDLPAQKQQIVFYGNWNPSAWKCVYQLKLFTNSNLKQGGTSSLYVPPVISSIWTLTPTLCRGMWYFKPYPNWHDG